ncbi:MAG: hypothetical protein NTX50_27960 [Candidatus Sumerlaeota bacterium]|nr:hypothetical protein [Candidatus Sumerlaeota bacterium]
MPDEKITKDIFLRILTRFGKISAEGKPDKNNETLKVTQSIAPVLFNLLDLNKDGVLERREIDLLKCLLPHFSPAILNHSQKHQDRSLDAEPALSW